MTTGSPPLVIFNEALLAGAVLAETPLDRLEPPAPAQAEPVQRAR